MPLQARVARAFSGTEKAQRAIRPCSHAGRRTRRNWATLPLSRRVRCLLGLKSNLHLLCASCDRSLVGSRLHERSARYTIIVVLPYVASLLAARLSSLSRDVRRKNEVNC